MYLNKLTSVATEFKLATPVTFLSSLSPKLNTEIIETKPHLALELVKELLEIITNLETKFLFLLIYRTLVAYKFYCQCIKLIIIFLSSQFLEQDDSVNLDFEMQILALLEEHNFGLMVVHRLIFNILQNQPIPDSSSNNHFILFRYSILCNLVP
jgi:hypothetical protein